MGKAIKQPPQLQSQPKMPKDMPREVYDNALRDAFDQMAAGRRQPTRWTIEIDRELWRAHKDLGMGSRPISTVMLQVHGWGGRSSVETRLRLLKKHGGPEGVPR